MINWLILIFYFINISGYITPIQILTINLPIIVISRAVYIISYYYRYPDLLQKEQREKKKVFFTNNFKLYYVIKQIVIFLGGLIYFPLSIGVTIYSFYLAGDNGERISERKKLKSLKILSIALKPLVSLSGIILFIITQDYFALAGISIALLIYGLRGAKRIRLSQSDLISKYRTLKLNTSRIGKILHATSFILIILISLLMLTGVSIYSQPNRNSYNIEMRDGIKLATDVYYSPGSFGTPKPVILVRTPYGKSGWAYDLYTLFYFIQDYHIVIQDLRGTFDSEGGQNFLLFTKSYQDGVDTIDWISKQPWCNGKIGSVGVSALCINQYFYAGMKPTGLKTQSLWFGTPELFDHAIYQGSYHKSSVETWIETTAPENYDFQINTIFDYFPKNETMYNSTSLSIPLGPTYSNISVSGLHVGGWYDHFLQGTIDGYVGYDDYGASTAQGRQKLIMGPWTHGSIYGGKQGQLTYPENSNGFNLIFDWEQEIFNEALLGIPADWDGARVAYYLMGDVDTNGKWNYWRYAYDWPLDYVNNSYYFHENGFLNNSNPSVNFNYSYNFDPRDPVPTLGGQNQPFDLNGPYDQRPIENRSDVLFFETDTLTGPIEIVGRIWGNLFVTSNCTDTDFTVKLTDVYPDGRSMLITDGSLTGRSRNGYTTENFMTGNKNDVYELMVDCWSTAYTFAAGHKIRVAISSSNYPRYAINPNTGAPLAENYLNYNIANNTLLIGPGYPSSIILPSLVNMSTTHTSY
ncbi:MAG: CocE/NonD family hydrolase [Candidatus Lokiarchaeota archaeon]|nr:CocE/NonD family hydrolase [Candidatus Lokiarchaeota archaeon]MBD3201938.1 CocE/NonD family hydrolase [Candidatus Lokiarchaeota archaeon]